MLCLASPLLILHTLPIHLFPVSFVLVLTSSFSCILVHPAFFSFLYLYLSRYETWFVQLFNSPLHLTSVWQFHTIWSEPKLKSRNNCQSSKFHRNSLGGLWDGEIWLPLHSLVMYFAQRMHKNNYSQCNYGKWLLVFWCHVVLPGKHADHMQLL